MSNLSRILGDVYGTDATESLRPASDTETAQPDLATGEPAISDAGGEALAKPAVLPDWADEAVLDEAFATWVPGPPPEAPEAEHSILRDLAAEFAMPAAFDEADDGEVDPAAEVSDPAAPIEGESPVALLDRDLLDDDLSDRDVVPQLDRPDAEQHDAEQHDADEPEVVEAVEAPAPTPKRARRSLIRRGRDKGVVAAGKGPEPVAGSDEVIPVARLIDPEAPDDAAIDAPAPALTVEPVVAAPEPVRRPVPTGPWNRHHDDIVGSGGGRARKLGRR